MTHCKEINIEQLFVLTKGNWRQKQSKHLMAFIGDTFFSHQVPSTTYKQVKAGYDLHFSLV